MRGRRLRRWGIAVIVAALVVVGLVGWKATANGDGLRFAANFDHTVGLYPGSDVEILGVPVGTVTAVTPEADHVHVEMELDENQSVSADTKAVIVAPTMVSDRYVQLTAPYDGGPKLQAGAVIPQSRTAVPVEIDQLYKNLTQVFDALGPEGANKHGALSRLLNVAAKNLKGQGHNLHTMITEFGKATDTLTGVDKDFFATVGNLKRFTDMLGANDDAVAHFNRQLAKVSSYLASDRHDMAAAVHNLGGALAIVDDFIRKNRSHLKTSVDNLRGPTKVLVRQQKSLEEAVRMIPVALQNYLNAYNPTTNSIDGRGDLNELTIWSSNGLSAQSSRDAPPTMIPPSSTMATSGAASRIRPEDAR